MSYVRKSHCGLYSAQQWKKEEGERLRGERDPIKFSVQVLALDVTIPRDSDAWNYRELVTLHTHK